MVPITYKKFLVSVLSKESTIITLIINKYVAIEKNSCDIFNLGIWQNFKIICSKLNL